MHLHLVDITIIAAYLCLSVAVGYWVSHRASRSIHHYFLGGNVMPWYVLGVSDASGMFDIGGTMWLVFIMFVYGLKSIWIPWVWPVFNQVFLMVYLSSWLRRSNAMTGAEWIKTRFGEGKGAQLSHIIVVIFALVSVVGFLSYAFTAIGKFAIAFLPWHLSANAYATIFMAITAIYVVKGGMFSVVVTEVIQFFILAASSITLGVIAMNKVSAEALHRAIPAGWDSPFFHWRLDLDWSALIASVNENIASHEYSIFGAFFMMILFKGFLVSAAGPAPNYDMQRILSTRSPKEASLMNMWVNVVLIFPRYFLIAGLTVLALVFYSDTIRGMGTNIDLEMILPDTLARFVPTGLLGVIVAGLLAAFMSNFAATVNAAPPYIVNDIYKRFINPNADPKTYVRLSYVASLGVVIFGVTVGWFVGSIDSVIQWITAALWGGYTASNVLKWYWWRFNGYGYFWGMVSGIGASLLLALAQQRELTTLTALSAFPLILALSLVGCFVGTLFTPAEDDAVLKSFYRRVRPWGFWGPILEKVKKDDPSFEPNHDFGRDMFNIAVGICWQTSLVAFPVFLVIHKPERAVASATVAAVTALILKFTWYDNLDAREARAAAPAPVPAGAPAAMGASEA
jgi:Na+/proline symporter